MTLDDTESRGRGRGSRAYVVRRKNLSTATPIPVDVGAHLREQVNDKLYLFYYGGSNRETSRPRCLWTTPNLDEKAQ